MYENISNKKVRYNNLGEIVNEDLNSKSMDLCLVGFPLNVSATNSSTISYGYRTKLKCLQVHFLEKKNLYMYNVKNSPDIIFSFNRLIVKKCNRFYITKFFPYFLKDIFKHRANHQFWL